VAVKSFVVFETSSVEVFPKPQLFPIESGWLRLFYVKGRVGGRHQKEKLDLWLTECVRVCVSECMCVCLVCACLFACVCFSECV